MTASLPRLVEADRRDLLAVTQRVLSELYCHLPQKKARYGLDPIVRLQRLRDTAELSQRTVSDRDFFRQYLTVLHSLRDLHTGLSFTTTRTRNCVAALPVLIERCGPANKGRYLVTKVADELGDRVTPGTAVTHWNGVPIDVVVASLAARGRGANPAAATARAVEHLTARPLDEHLAPDEDWVTLTFADGNDLRLEWQTLRASDIDGALGLHVADNEALGLDRAGRANQYAKRYLYASKQLRAPFFKAVPHQVGRIKAGHLRIYSFLPDDPSTALGEITAAVQDLVGQGCRLMIVDIRANPGGIIPLAEQVLGLFSASAPKLSRFAFLATPLTRDLCVKHPGLSRWRASVTSAASTGDVFTAALPITDLTSIPQQICALPAVLVTDAMTYSAGDLFAAGWADNEIGPIVATAATTGAGGANVWSMAQLLPSLPDSFGGLPAGLDIRVSLRRAVRAGKSDSLPIEDLGVEADHVLPITEADLLHGNHRLLNAVVRYRDATVWPPAAD